MDLSDRYARNHSSITAAEQLRLSECRVLVVGAGGLGSQVLEGLARLGVGHILICDPDTTEASNLNRQLLATETNLGRSKVELARERAQAINSSIELRAFQEAFPSPELVAALPACDAVIDCLDSIEARQILEARCHESSVPLVYGSIAGSYIYTGLSTLENPLAANQSRGGAGLEKELGNPYPTVAIAAGLQLQLALSVLLGRPVPTQGFYVMDLTDFTLEHIKTN